MSNICCVDGCPPPKDDVTFFRFPNSRTLKRKWLEAIPSTVRVTVDTTVCSRHFLAEQYEVVRSKRRLKAKVVPSVFDTIAKPTPKTDDPKADIQTDSIKEIVNDVTIDNNTDVEQKTTSPQHRIEDDEPLKGNNESSTQNGHQEDIVKRTEPDNVSITDSEISNKDIEDIIANYQIKQTRPLHKDTESDLNGETERNNAKTSAASEQLKTVEIEIEGTSEVIDVDNVADPVFIEVSVGKDGGVQEASNQDCMLLLESVQCEVDPSCLVFPDPEPEPDSEGADSDVVDLGERWVPLPLCRCQEASDQDCMLLLESVQCEVDPSCLVFPDPEPEPDSEGADSDVVDLGERKEDPISLLTSSDEDEVIVQEPEYDMVEVSDETDEDDVPLVKLVAKPKSKSKVKAKKTKDKSNFNRDALTKILWGQLYEYFCFECHFKTTSRAEFKAHSKDHSTVIQVCQLCDYTTSSNQQFIRHKRKHREEKKYKCHLCKYKARHNMSLIYHMKSHEEVQIIEDGVFKCEKCDFKTSVKRALLQHIRACRVKRFSCNSCRYKTNRRSDMKRHKSRIHRDSDDDDDYVP
ncbi:uncharacterized protein LOC112045710 [Bicyclus anynana]|uniref:Protein hunchback n=1 Tax=Bicyclus anynana TaxID=110368 RepID=A0ABM3M2T6_BICAN|nr:uncharacterized protein LOC112045710 [Bicyclus anynana]